MGTKIKKLQAHTQLYRMIGISPEVSFEAASATQVYVRLPTKLADRLFFTINKLMRPLISFEVADDHSNSSKQPSLLK